MDFRYPPEAEEFRASVRAWLEANLPADLRGVTVRDDLTPALVKRLRAWNRTLADAGYAGMSWPEEYGGRAASVIEQVVLAEEMSRAEAPGPINVIGLSNIAPAIMTYGTAAQKERFLLPMLRGDEIWCQGFSEPNAGSDLASITTSARRDGDDFVVNGQKVWNTLGEYANWCELLVRTNPAAAKHEGISCLLVDLASPGVVVRPIVTITGGREFAELFFEDVRVPASALLGPLDGGWKVAMATLSHERAGVASLHLQVRKKVARLIVERDGAPLGADPGKRRELARAYLLAEHMKFLADRALSASIQKRIPGPEGSLAKLVWSDTEDAIAAIAGRVLGPEANSGRFGDQRVYVRATSIAGGTSQVNRNIIATRVLGLPKGS